VVLTRFEAADELDGWAGGPDAGPITTISARSA
jgi:hypothetical protein